MDSKVVSAEIRGQTWKALREAGFTAYNARNAWRRKDQTVEVVNFQSFSSHKADSLRCTPFSFAVNLGVYYYAVHDAPWHDELPTMWQIRPEKPAEYRCHARLHPGKMFEQRQYPRRDIWFINPDGANVIEAVQDATTVITGEGLKWLERFSDLDNALQECLTSRSVDRKEYISAFGTLGGAEIGSAIALALKKPKVAIALWQAVLEKPYYQRLPD